MQLAFDDLGIAAAGPDRFADSSNGPPVRGRGELTPGRDDQRRISAELGHVGEHDQVGVIAQRVPHGLQTGLGHGHHDLLAALQAVLDERHDGNQELVDAPIQLALVPIAVVRLRCAVDARIPPMANLRAAAATNRNGQHPGRRTPSGITLITSGMLVHRRRPTPAGLRLLPLAGRWVAARPHQPQMPTGPYIGQRAGGGHHEFDKCQGRLDQSMVDRDVGDDLVEHALITGSGDDVVAPGDDVATDKPLHSSPCLPLPIPFSWLRDAATTDGTSSLPENYANLTVSALFNYLINPGALLGVRAGRLREQGAGVNEPETASFRPRIRADRWRARAWNRRGRHGARRGWRPPAGRELPDRPPRWRRCR